MSTTANLTAKHIAHGRNLAQGRKGHQQRLAQVAVQPIAALQLVPLGAQAFEEPVVDLWQVARQPAAGVLSSIISMIAS